MEQGVRGWLAIEEKRVRVYQGVPAVKDCRGVCYEAPSIISRREDAVTSEAQKMLWVKQSSFLFQVLVNNSAEA